jgi:hypothetical protein
METAARVGIGKRPDVLAASSKFGTFKPETERNVRKHDVVTNPSLEAMRSAWRKVDSYTFPDSDFDDPDYLMSYARIYKTVKKLGYSAKDVEEFSIALGEFRDADMFAFKAGYLLSVLMNNC